MVNSKASVLLIGAFMQSLFEPKNKIALDALEKAVRISDSNSMVKKIR